ncbi:biotin-dependent carboxyltransferase family protein [Amycolatopsis rhabdoformis]|uniref:Biotin-dependent carboxyltransferase family protein n=1 Tax=Amycolatopsis rhabdoformis TaxID=1448059 RepID=A0ABZ1I0T1_9PSEU|nr:biotin-dependent carboxyltransferase family protein [Amycolatopsis rhabdoformis]WSE28020.1 biotin-dependent carboxyltransferase family protein [Amycolatopsis rhabdoformis]
MRALEIVATGPLALVQDLGRPGYAHLGVPPSGALDVEALRLGNRLVGNPAEAAGIEALLGGLVVRATTSCTVAVTGPVVPVRVDERDAGSHTAVSLRAGQTLALGRPSAGLRSYLAVSGGLAVAPVLGSRSRDVLSAIGPEPLEDGVSLPLGPVTGVPAGADVVVTPAAPERLVVPVVLGPRDDWFTGLADGLGAWWSVTSESNRVGLRLDGPPLRRENTAELPSEGLVTGAIQVPPSGLPVVFLADHPTTGGYPVAAVVRRGSLGALAQARPGTFVRFRPS